MSDVEYYEKIDMEEKDVDGCKGCALLGNELCAKLTCMSFIDNDDILFSIYKLMEPQDE